MTTPENTQPAEISFYTAPHPYGAWTQAGGFTIDSTGILQIAPGGTRMGQGEVWYPPSGDTTGATDGTRIAGFLAAGTVVHLLPEVGTGPYYINATITVPGGGVLTGPPSAVNTSPGAVDVMPAVIKLVSGSNNIHMISIAGNNAYVGNLELDGNRAGQTGGYGNGILFNNQYFTVIERCFIHDQYYRGIDCVSGVGGKFLDCSVTENNDVGIYMDPASTDNHIRGSLIASNGSDGIYSAGYVNHILENDIWGNAGNGVKISGGRGALISGNGIDRNRQNGIVVTSPSGSYAGSVAITGNTIHSNGLAANVTYYSVTIDNSLGNVDGVSIEGNNFWLDGGVTNKVAYHIFHGGTVVTKTHGNQFQAGSYATGTINVASQAKDANETG